MPPEEPCHEFSSIENPLTAQLPFWYCLVAAVMTGGLCLFLWTWADQRIKVLKLQAFMLFPIALLASSLFFLSLGEVLWGVRTP
ncbi:hypothetical protein GCM10008955_15410 [Deinococcus malanensis]|uniref:Uncharacterized protein n=2 Tax=Deinococcus malanensis TaxID=1706855 RepID=A0ABQ2ERX0_9DEIO|nr:hypothetical protein [Deinococcus malanensis]GGK22860.1 hypothetical protein GCM10008955_15410 [Deinococcus malanensis]